MAWEERAISEKQLSVLKRAGINPETVHGTGHASKLIGLYFAQQNSQPASEAQKKIMRRMRYPNAESATAEEARKFFARLNNERKERKAA
jgi:hypothetical protein